MKKFKLLLILLVLSLSTKSQSLVINNYEAETIRSEKNDNNQNIAKMLRKLTFLYENMSSEWLQEISKPNQQISRVQELAYNISLIKEILGYTNAIIDSTGAEKMIESN